MHGGQCARAWALLCLRCARAVRALGAGKDAARSQDQDVAVGELLLELAGEAGVAIVSAIRKVEWEEGFCLPLLHTVETLKGWDGDKDDNSLLAVADLNLHRSKSACDLHCYMVRSPSESNSAPTPSPPVCMYSLCSDLPGPHIGNTTVSRTVVPLRNRSGLFLLFLFRGCEIYTMCDWVWGRLTSRADTN